MKPPSRSVPISYNISESSALDAICSQNDFKPIVFNIIRSHIISKSRLFLTHGVTILKSSVSYQMPTTSHVNHL